MKHITHDKGDLGVIKVQAKLIEMEHQIFVPISSASPYDLIVLIGNEFKKVQVKYVTSKNNCITISTRRAIRNGNAKYCTNTDIDILAIYCPCTNECYFLYKDTYIEAVSLRLTIPKNNQIKNIRMANDFTKL